MENKTSASVTDMSGASDTRNQMKQSALMMPFRFNILLPLFPETSLYNKKEFPELHFPHELE
ncbi:hypothetical protein PT2222_180152 [Paraburkholderia tropica]